MGTSFANARGTSLTRVMPCSAGWLHHSLWSPHLGPFFVLVTAQHTATLMGLVMTASALGICYIKRFWAICRWAPPIYCIIHSKCLILRMPRPRPSSRKPSDLDPHIPYEPCVEQWLQTRHSFESFLQLSLPLPERERWMRHAGMADLTVFSCGHYVAARGHHWERRDLDEAVVI